MANVAARPRVGLFHCTLTGAAVLGVVFLLCWATEAVADVHASHAFLALFTEQALSTPRSMTGGLATAIVAGGLLGALAALFFNVFSFLAWGARTEPSEAAD
jgi:hypothetical protein